MKSALICDRDPAVRGRVRNKLMEYGYSAVHETEDGAAAVSLAFEGLPDIAIVDADSGLREACDIRRKLGIPVILLLSRYDQETMSLIKKSGVTTMLGKPFREQDLLPALEMAVALSGEVDLLKADVEVLNIALENQAIIYKAKKVLQRSADLSESDAFKKIQKLAMDSKKSMRQIAETILNPDWGKRKKN